MSELQNTRRIYKMVKKVVIEKQPFINPQYDKQQALHLASIGRTDEQKKHVFVDVPILKEERISFIQHSITCAHCDGQAWMYKANAKYCSKRCRSAALIERKKAKGK